MSFEEINGYGFSETVRNPLSELIQPDIHHVVDFCNQFLTAGEQISKLMTKSA